MSTNSEILNRLATLGKNVRIHRSDKACTLSVYGVLEQMADVVYSVHAPPAECLFIIDKVRYIKLAEKPDEPSDIYLV